MVYKHQASYLETGRTPRAVTPNEHMFRNMFQGSSDYASQVPLVCQPIPSGAVAVLRKKGFEKPCRTSPMEQFVGGIAS